MSFNTGSPVAVTTSAMSTIEASSSVSDMEGNIMFYTHGTHAWNREGVRLSETAMTGDNSSSQGAMIVPRPGQEGHHYIFCADAIGGATGLQYSEVDMAGNGGLGSFVSLNTPLVTPVCEKITACYHANGTDIWITVHQWNSDAFYSYLVTGEGVNPVPVISNAGDVIGGASNSGKYAGYMAVSPDGSRLAIANNGVNAELFNFDNATGVVSDAVTLYTGACYGIAFSPDSSKLYLTYENKLWQYDTDAADVPSTQTFIADMEASGALRLAPDSKIYVVSKMISSFLSVINDPDADGTACNYTPNSVELAGRQTFAGLPAMLTSPFYLLDLTKDQNCSGTVTFSASSTIAPESIIWDFGDGDTSTEVNPTHTYAAPGTYTVKVTAKRGIFMRYFAKAVIVTAPLVPVANQPGDLTLCNGDPAPTFNLRGQDAVILGTQPASDYTVTYHLTTEDANAGTAALPDTFPGTVGSTTIYARITNNETQCYAITSFLVTVWPEPVLNMPAIGAICEGSTLTLEAPAGFDAYLWSTGAVTRSITVTTAGEYTITVTEDHDGQLCNASKTITVTASEAPVISDIQISDWTDDRNSITILAEGAGDYEYSLNNAIWQASPTFDDLLPGIYTVYARDRNGCGEAEDEIVLLMYPKFFTPNGDGHHDAWQVKYAFFEPDMLIHIFDRYGKVVASFRGDTFGWDGRFNGRDLPSTDYWFVVERQDGRMYRGHFAMLR